MPALSRHPGQPGWRFCFGDRQFRRRISLLLFVIAGLDPLLSGLSRPSFNRSLIHRRYLCFFQSWIRSALPLVPVSPLEGEMSGNRTEGGAQRFLEFGKGLVCGEVEPPPLCLLTVTSPPPGGRLEQAAKPICGQMHLLNRTAVGQAMAWRRWRVFAFPLGTTPDGACQELAGKALAPKTLLWHMRESTQQGSTSWNRSRTISHPIWCVASPVISTSS